MVPLNNKFMYKELLTKEELAVRLNISVYDLDKLRKTKISLL